MSNMKDLERQDTVNTANGDLEVGVTEAIERHYARHVVHRRPVSQQKLDFERRRPRWLREMMAEATGVFFYVYPGIASVCAFTLNGADNPGLILGLFQIGLAFAIGIAFAIIVCGPTSGGHFNPAITICFAYWNDFPVRKVPLYIFSQIFGAFVAGLLLMGQYHVQISEFAASELAKLGSTAYNNGVYNGGPASILCPFPGSQQTNLGYLFLTEFFVDTFIGIVIWACLDPANPFIGPTTAPFAIGLVYAIMVWGFADITISTNLARDLGTRFVAATFYGKGAFTYMNYSWIAILVNVPATFLATCYYEFLMRDSLMRIGKGDVVHAEGGEGLQRHLTQNGIIRSPSDSQSDVTVSEAGGKYKQGA